MRCRSLEQKDIAECVELLAGNPVIAPRYGELIRHLPALFLRLIERGLGAVFFSEAATSRELAGFGITVVVHDQFVREVKVAPHFWIGPELVRRFLKDELPWLTLSQMEEESKRNGLNLVCFDNCARPGYEADIELHCAMMDTFIRIHRGYFWKEIIANQPESRERAEFLLSTGGGVWDSSLGRYATDVLPHLDCLIGKPCVFGVTREQSVRQPWSGRWVTRLFDCPLPRIAFTLAEKRLLSAGLSGSTDEELARLLRVSLSTVKKSWLSIYDRVAVQTPDLIADPGESAQTDGKRGREKRRGVLAYLRNHPEELRPLSGDW